jgi:hypothetical protein
MGFLDKIKKTTKKAYSQGEKYMKEGGYKDVVVAPMGAHSKYLEQHPDSKYSRFYDKNQKIINYGEYSTGGKEDAEQRAIDRLPDEPLPTPVTEATAGMGDSSSLLDRYGRRKTKVAGKGNTAMREYLGGQS